MDKIQRFEKDLAKIRAATNISTLEKFISTFSKREERNLTTLKYVNDLSNEIEGLEKAIAELKVINLAKDYHTLQEEKNKHEDLPVTKDFEKIRALKYLDEELLKLEEKIEYYDSQSYEADQKLTSIYVCIFSF